MTLEDFIRRQQQQHVRENAALAAYNSSLCGMFCDSLIKRYLTAHDATFAHSQDTCGHAEHARSSILDSSFIIQARRCKCVTRIDAVHAASGFRSAMSYFIGFSEIGSERRLEFA